MRWGIWSLLTGGVLLMSPGAQAHHSHGPFYLLDETIELTGIVKSFRLINPHPEIVIEINGDDGEPEDVLVYAQAYAGQMREVGGWTDDSVKVGETITVLGHPGRPSVSSVMGQYLTTASGEVLNMRFFDLLKPPEPESQ